MSEHMTDRLCRWVEWRSPVLALTIAVVLAVGSGRAIAADEYDGKVHSVSEGQVVLMVGTEQLMFNVDHKTAITLDGKSVKLTELKPGDSARLTSELAEGAERLAIKIVARRGNGPIAATT